MCAEDISAEWADGGDCGQWVFQEDRACRGGAEWGKGGEEGGGGGVGVGYLCDEEWVVCEVGGVSADTGEDGQEEEGEGKESKVCWLIY